jgi:hypothetical protein
MLNIITIAVEFTPATNQRGARVRLGFNLANKRKFIPYSYEARDAEDTALRFLAEKGLIPFARTCLSPSQTALLFPFESFAALQSALS